MAVAQSSWHQQKKKMLLFVGPMLHLHRIKCTLSTIGHARIQQEAHGNGDGSNSSGDIDMCGNVRRLCKQGRLTEAIHILYLMDQRGIRPDSSIYASLLQECANRKALREGKLVHAHMIDTRFNPEILSGTKLVMMYAKCGSLADARRVLDEMPERNASSWTAMISGYAQNGHYREASALFFEMQRTGIQPNQYTFSSILPAFANLAALEHGKKVHEDIINRGFQSNIFVGNALVDMYAKCGAIEDARQVFEKMPERNVVSWNAMIAGYAQNGYVDEALNLFMVMVERDVISWTAMIAGYAQKGYVDEAMKLFQKIPERNVVSWNAMVAGCAQSGHVDDALNLLHKMPVRNVISWNTIIAGYAQEGHVDVSLKLFQNMPERNVVSWNTVIAGYEQNGYFNEAMNLFRQMQLTDVKPVPGTFSSVLPACANMSALKHGKEVHQNIIRSGFESDMFVGSALVDMYAKCGSIEYACQVFDKMPERDVVAWNAMIVGYAVHGCGKTALQLFEQMQHCGMKADPVTFVGVLSACCHAGLVDEGRQYFNSMSRDHQLTPVMEHYCCVVDLLGRAGCLDEALDFINKMPVTPSASVWGSLLGACRIHTNIEIAEHVAKHLFELEPKNAANYVLLSNIYAAAGRWTDVEKVRKLRKARKIKRSPGCSWIEINNKVHSFFVKDRSEPQIHNIYTELERFTGQMEEAAYEPNMNLVLHDQDEQQKEYILYSHS